MANTTPQSIFKFATAAIMSACLSTTAQAELAQSPLDISSKSVIPNILLLIDDSGSMAQIIWHDQYNPNTTYPHWGERRLTSEKRWDKTQLKVLLGSITSEPCSSGYTSGYNGYQYKCLRLPDPVPPEANTRYTANYLNYLFSRYPSDSNLRDGRIPQQIRMQVARNVATTLVGNNQNLRFCLADFHLSSGGQVSHQCSTNNAAMVNAINALRPSTWTPLAETFYEITRYFGGKRGWYNDIQYSSPIQYRCQSNFVIVVTDGLPTRDFDPDDAKRIPHDSRQDFGLSDGSPPNHSLPDWDGLSPTAPLQFSDGANPQHDNANGRLYLDDLALFGRDIDLMRSGLDQSGMPFGDAANPDDSSDFAQQNLRTFTIGFTIDN